MILKGTLVKGERGALVVEKVTSWMWLDPPTVDRGVLRVFFGAATALCFEGDEARRIERELEKALSTPEGT